MEKRNSSKLVVWTRSLDDWGVDKTLRALRDVPVLHLPCIKTSPIPLQSLPTGFEAAVFTSAKAVQFAFAEVSLGHALKKIDRFFTFGSKTAAAISSRQLTCETAPNLRNSESLEAFLAVTLPPGSRVLVLGPKTPAYDLAGGLTKRGFQASYLAIYETTSDLALDQEETSRLTNTLSGVVCFASPSAVAAFTACLKPTRNCLSKELRAVAIGETTKAACMKDFVNIITAPEPTVESLAETAAATFRTLP